MKLSGIICGVALAWTGVLVQAQPDRVVSMNLCTDQLAMILAAPEQLVSVSYIARDPRASAMADEAQGYPVNHGLAEEIYLLDPDLVIAGRFSTRTTVDMLRRLDVPVVVFDPAWSLEDVRANILKMGEVLGRSEAASELLAEYDRGLNAIMSQTAERPRAATYSAGSWMSGPQSLAGEIMEAAGLDNIAPELGLESGGAVPLELLAMAQPELLITASPYPGHSRAEGILDHPVVDYLQTQSATTAMLDRSWVCGTPHVLSAIRALTAARDAYLKGVN